MVSWCARIIGKGRNVASLSRMKSICKLRKNGLIVKEQSGFFWGDAVDGTTYMCELRGKLKEAERSSDIAAIGDLVTITLRREEGTDVADGSSSNRSPRARAPLSRALRTTGKRGAGQAEREDVIVANADRAVFVLAAAQPTPNLKMLDRLTGHGRKIGYRQVGDSGQQT